MKRKLLATLLAVCMMLTPAPAAFAVEDGTESTAKTLIVQYSENSPETPDGSADNPYTTIQAAVNVASGGDTIQVKAVLGHEYDAFTVENKANLTIEGICDTDNNKPVIKVNAKAPTNASCLSDAVCPGQGMTGLKFSNLVFKNYGFCDAWYSSSISYRNDTGTNVSGMVIDQCDFIVAENATNVPNYAAFMNNAGFTFTNNTVVGYVNGITSMADGSALKTATITGNTFDVSSQAFHGYWGNADTSAEGKIVFTGNTITNGSAITLWDYANTPRDGHTTGTGIKEVILDVDPAEVPIVITNANQSMTKLVNTNSEALTGVVYSYSSGALALANAKDDSTFYIDYALAEDAENPVYTKTSATQYVDEENNTYGAYAATVTYKSGDTTTITEYTDLPAAIAAANAVESDAPVTVTICSSGTYVPFTARKAGMTIQAADGVKVTIHTANQEGSRMRVTAENVTLKGIDFVSTDGSAVLQGGDNYCTGYNGITVENCTFTSQATADNTALYLHHSSITVKNCEFDNWERGYYCCGDNTQVGTITLTGNTFTNVKIPIDGYWGQSASDDKNSSTILITGNTFHAPEGETAYIQLWDYAQYQYWLKGSESTLNPNGGSAFNSVTISGNTYDGDVVIYKTHCDWYADSNVSIEDTDAKVVNRKLVEVKGLENGDSVTVTNADGSAITGFGYQESNKVSKEKNGQERSYIYSISTGDYTLHVAHAAGESDTSVVTTADLNVTDPVPGSDTQDIVIAPLDEDDKYVAQVGEVKYTSLTEAIKAAKDGGTVDILQDVTIDTWNQVWGVDGMTINGNGHTITIDKVESGSNGDYLLYEAKDLNVSDLTIDLNGGNGFSMLSGKLENVTMNGNNTSYGVFVSAGAEDGKVEINKCTFTGFTVAAVYSQPVNNETSIAATSDISVTNSVITDCGMAMCSYAANTTFTGNTVTGGSEVSFAAAADNNNQAEDKDISYTITGNTFTDAGKIWFYGADLAEVEFTQNQILGTTSVSTEGAKAGTTLDATGNYWGGQGPNSQQVSGDNVMYENYYTAPTMRPEDLNTYVPLVTVTYETTRGEVPASKTMEAGKAIELPVLPNDGYWTFLGWTSDGKNYAGGETVIVEANMTFIARWRDDTPYIPYPPAKPNETAKPVEPEEPATSDTWTNPYTDVAANDWYYDAVAYVTAKGLMTGTTASTFAPNDTMTRAMVWTVLARMEGQSVEGGSPWYALAQSWAMNAAVSDGTGPNDSITREQLVTMLYRQAGSPEVGVPELAKLGQFSDGEAVSDWAQSAMAWAVANGILTGEAGALNPQASATRGQVAAILMRFCQQ